MIMLKGFYFLSSPSTKCWPGEATIFTINLFFDSFIETLRYNSYAVHFTHLVLYFESLCGCCLPQFCFSFVAVGCALPFCVLLHRREYKDYSHQKEISHQKESHLNWDLS